MAIRTRLSAVLARKPRVSAAQTADARWFQLAGQASILSIGLTLRAFDIDAAQIAGVFLAALSTQWILSVVFAARFEWKSAAITALSICLLLRADGVLPLAAAAASAIGSKFLIRWRGRHLFNPANFAIVGMLSVTDLAWTSTSQWGSTLWFALFIAAAGTFITRKATRFDVPIVFLATYAALLFARAVYLGDPLSIPLLRLQNGELVLFAFFMLTDPRTTPDRLPVRAAFIAATALLGYILQFNYFVSDGLFYAAFALACVRPLFEILHPAMTRFVRPAPQPAE